jgi:ferritin-like metal-binding protein YciE
MAKAATSRDLKQAFESHLEEIKGQIQRFDRAFEILGKIGKGKKCHGMEGVLEEGSEVLKETAKGSVRDAVLISAAQRVEHYEMAGYGVFVNMLRFWAKMRLPLFSMRRSRKKKRLTRNLE